MKRSLQTIIVTVALIHLFCVCVPVSAATRTQSKSLAERLGYPAGTKLLIVHADDLGMAHSVDAASVKAFESGLVTSGSIMIPCPWFSEIAAYARSHPEADLGLHLTLTSEWSLSRWGPVLSKESAPSLFDQSGYLYATEDVAAAHINAREAEAEIRAQIERARAYGIRSEERRVGKEWRSRWAPDHYKKNRTRLLKRHQRTETHSGTQWKAAEA